MLHCDSINPETLLVLMKSMIGQLQLKKGCSGTILTAISKGKLKKIVLPIVPPNIQVQIKKQISKMYEVRRKAKTLLDIAKCGVEKAIEKDEKSALRWMEKEKSKL